MVRLFLSLASNSYTLEGTTDNFVYQEMAFRSIGQGQGKPAISNITLLEDRRNIQE